MALLKRPPEICQNVYKELLVFAPYNKGLPQSTEHRSADPQLRRPQGVQLLRVCKTIYYEAVYILYSNNVFMAWTYDEVALLEHYLYEIWRKLDPHAGKRYVFWENHVRVAVSRLFGVDSGSKPTTQPGLLDELGGAISRLSNVDSGGLPNPLSGVLSSTCNSQSSINLTQVCTSTELLTLKIKGNPNAKQPGIERNTAMSSFPAFLRAIGLDNARKIRAVQLPLVDRFFTLYRSLVSEIFRQHLPNLAHLVVDWDGARCHCDLKDLPAEPLLHCYPYHRVSIVLFELRTVAKNSPSIKGLTFVDGLTEFNEMGRMILDKETYRLADLKAVWTSTAESRRNLGSPCSCRHKKSSA